MNGWVEAEVQTVRTSRKSYHITNLGLDVLKEWLRESRPFLLCSSSYDLGR